MSVEILTYAALGARLNISHEAARSLARRLKLPRSLSNDGKALASIDLAEIRHTPRPPRGRAISSSAKIETLKAEIARLEARAADDRADFERERERANRLAVELQQATAETVAAQEVTARVEALKAEIARLEAKAADDSADFERERADRLAVELLQATAATMAAEEVTARLEASKAEIARLEARAADDRADFTRERERADRLAAELQQAAAATMAAEEVAARLEASKAEIARLEARAADDRADFERERERANRLAVELQQATAETVAAQEVTARLEDEVVALRSGGQTGSSVDGHAARRLGYLAASIVQADRKACR
jgi:chromosome segregation ATPase